MSKVAVASQSETEEPKLQTPWELTADCTRFVLKWSEELHRPKVESIFDVLRGEVRRRQGLSAYGVKRLSSKSNAKALRSQASSSALLPAETARAIPAYAPKLLSNSEAA